MAADLVIKRKDTWEPLKMVLSRRNPSTKELEPIDLGTAIKVTLYIKPARSPTTNVQLCTAWGGGAITTSTGASAGQIEYSWHQTDLEPTVLPETYAVEAKIEWPTTAGVKRIQSVPNNRDLVLEVVADLGP